MIYSGKLGIRLLFSPTCGFTLDEREWRDNNQSAEFPWDLAVCRRPIHRRPAVVLRRALSNSSEQQQHRQTADVET